MKNLNISPPLLNSSNPWCTSLEQLQDLYKCPYTGAVTTRTSLIDGFEHKSSVNQFAFFNPSDLSASEPNKDQGGREDQIGSLNTLGYSPILLEEYLQYIKIISDGLSGTETSKAHKPFIISVTGDVDKVVECYRLISAQQSKVRMVLAMEINLSCPNIPGKPPPAYSSASLFSYLAALKKEISQLNDVIPIGIKTPPYTYHDQYQAMIDALLSSAEAGSTHLPCPVSFITATNTLGSSLLISPVQEGTSSSSSSYFKRTIESANESGIGGMAGAPLHPLALGNVYTIRGLLDQHEELKQIQIIGVGGVEDVHGFNRMKAVGAAAVGVGTALGRRGIKVFEEIGRQVENKE